MSAFRHNPVHRVTHKGPPRVPNLPLYHTTSFQESGEQAGPLAFAAFVA